MKDLKISKELISEVLGKDILNFTVNMDFIFIQKEKINYNLNIYEFAFKCKEWAYKQCYEIISYTEGCKIYQTQIGEIIKEFYADSEVKAIIKACTYILNNLSNK